MSRAVQHPSLVAVEKHTTALAVPSCCDTLLIQNTMLLGGSKAAATVTANCTVSFYITFSAESGLSKTAISLHIDIDQTFEQPLFQPNDRDTKHDTKNSSAGLT